MIVTEILKTFRAPPTLAARQDRAEKHSITLLDAGRQLRGRPQLLDDPDWFVAEDPGSWRLRVAVEKCPGVSAADATSLDPEDRTLWIDLRF